MLVLVPVLLVLLLLLLLPPLLLLLLLLLMLHTLFVISRQHRQFRIIILSEHSIAINLITFKYKKVFVRVLMSCISDFVMSALEHEP